MHKAMLTPDMIRRIRGDQTQSEFAREVGCHGAPLVSAWENGHRVPMPVFQRAMLRMAGQRGVAVDGTAKPGKG